VDTSWGKGPACRMLRGHACPHTDVGWLRGFL